MDVRTLIMRHEGLRLTPYRDISGHLSIGYGRNLADKGISAYEATILLETDIGQATAAAYEYPWFVALCLPRQCVIVDMIFNLGAAGFDKFVKLRQALAAGDWAAARNAILNSAWASQVGRRALEDATIIELGTWPEEEKP